MRSVYFGLESFGFAPMFTEKANRGEIDICEETESSLAMGLRAHMAGVGFMPSTAWIGTDLPKLRPDVKTIDRPVHGRRTDGVPGDSAATWRCCTGWRATRDGNVLLNNNLGVDLELMEVADTVIVTVERQVDAARAHRPTAC